MNKTFLKTLIASAALAATATASTGAFAQTKLKWAHVYETSEPFHTASVWAAAEIEKRTAGRYHIDVYPASQLGKENDINQGLTLGTVDLIISGSSFAAKSFPRIGVTYYPYTFRGVEHLLAYTKSDIYKELTQGYEEKSGNHIVATTYYGARHTTSNKPITKCADMKGLKIRVPDVPAYLAMPRACGANTSPIAFAEVYLAVQKYIALTGHIVDHLNTVVAGGLWKKLSDADKKVFADVAQEAAAKASAEVVAREKELVGVFKAKGLSVTDVDKADFRDTVLKNVTFESFGYRKADWDKIQAIK
jgi:TRAP-type C4-dicarboxylate transport system substrate-binding protein